MYKPLITYSFLSFLVFSFLVLGVSACQNATGPAAPPTEGDVVFTEFMPLQQPGDPNWAELHNTSDNNIALQNCTLSNQAKQTLSITAALIVEAGQRVLLSSSNEPTALAQADIVYPADEFQLLDKDTVTLRCDNRAIDQVAYSVGEPAPKNDRRSWQLHAHRSSSDSENAPKDATWCYTNPLENYQYTTNRFATPGKANSFCASKMPFIAFDDQAAVLVEGIDLVATLKVAEDELARKSATSELAIWGIRDQIITPDIARRISELYFANIDMLYDTTPFAAIDWNHAVWHFAWAISNLYRNGDQAVKDELQLAYEDALERPETLDRYKYIAIDYVRGETIVMGDTHTPAHDRMQQLIVAPGNPGYLKSYEDYIENRRSPLKVKAMHYTYLVAKFFSDLFN